MKLAFAFAAATAVTTPAFAADLPVPGLSLDTEIKMNHAVDAEATTLTINPELAWQPIIDGPATLTVGTTITAFDNTAGATFGDDIILFDAWEKGSRPAIELGATYALPVEGAEMFAETTWDVNDNERGEINIGVSFNF
jgi:maltoporin